MLVSKIREEGKGIVNYPKHIWWKVLFPLFWDNSIVDMMSKFESKYISLLKKKEKKGEVSIN